MGRKLHIKQQKRILTIVTASEISFGMGVELGIKNRIEQLENGIGRLEWLGKVMVAKVIKEAKG